MGHEIDVLSDDDWEVLCRTWYTGSYTDGHEWTIYTTPWEEPPRYAVRYRSLPDRSGVESDDVEPSASPGQSVRSSRRLPARTIQLDAEATFAMLVEGMIPVQIVGHENDFGLDGWHRGYEAKGFSQEVRLSWWCEGPQEWRSFIAWIERLQRYLHRELFPDEPEVPPLMRP